MNVSGPSTMAPTLLRGVPAALLTLAIVGTAPASESAPASETRQRHLALAGSAACEACRLEVGRIAVIYDPGMWDPAPQDLLRTSAGHFIVITTNPMEPLHFDAAGELVGQLGRKGEGPGEYGTPMSAVEGPDDTIWIFDRGLRRRTAWSPRGEYLRTYPLPARLQDAVILDDGRLVVSGPVMTPESMGFPLHLLSTDGELLDSFGTRVDVDPAGHVPGWIRRGLAPATGGGFWAFSRYGYRIERYTSRGELAMTLERDVEWFPERDPRASTTLAEDGPQPRISGLVQDERGLLRVVLSLPDPDWRQGLGERELQPGFEAAGIYWTPILDHAQVFDLAIEVIDPETEEVLVSERFDDGLTLGWVDEHHFATYREDDLKVPIIEIHRVDFRDGRTGVG